MIGTRRIIKRILNFNADFRFPAFSKFVKIIEINSDNLSRYSVAENVGFFPRYARYENIKKFAEQNGTVLNVLYNPAFSYNLDKARRWGINSPNELTQKTFFPATLKGIKNLHDQLQSSPNKNWVLLLSTYTIPHFYSYLYSDKRISAIEVQCALKQLLDRNKDNTVFIGEDTVFDKINNDKFLTSQILPADYQPRSTLMINGDDPVITSEDIIRSLNTEDLVIKPLSAHSGIGICRTQGKDALRKLFENMYEAKKRSEIAKLKMTLDTNNRDTFWFYTRGNNPFVHCQEYVPTHFVDDREITYRAVATAYIDENEEVKIDIECIYPKKSDPGDFLSRIHNEIKRDEIEEALYNSAIRKGLIPGLELFIKNVLNYNENEVIEKLLSGSNAEFLKGLKLRLESGDCLITYKQAERFQSLKENLAITAPQASENLHSVLKRDPKSTTIDDRVFELSSLRAGEKELLCGIKREDLFLTNLSSFTKNKQAIFFNSIPKEGSNDPQLIRFILLCKEVKAFISDSSNFSVDVLYSQGLYNLAVAIERYSDELLKHNRISRLVVAINLFELAQCTQLRYPCLLPVFTRDYTDFDPIISIFQNGGYCNESDESLVKALIALYSLPIEAITHFPETINGLFISDYTLLIADVLYERYYGKNRDLLVPQQALLTLFANWYAPNSVLFPHATSEELTWKMRSQAIRLLASGMEELNTHGIVSDSIYIHFLLSYLPHCKEEFSLYKGIELIYTLSQVARCDLNHKNSILFRNLGDLISEKTKELNISPEPLKKIQGVLQEISARFLRFCSTSDSISSLPDVRM